MSGLLEIEIVIEQAGGGTLFLLVAIGLAVLVALALLEAWMLYSGRRPITSYVRQGIRSAPGWAFVVALIVGVLFGHFFWP